MTQPPKDPANAGQSDDWLPIPGYEGLYGVTTDGRVWGERRKTFKAGWRKQQTNWRGYKTIVLRKGHKTTTHMVHRLVAATYLSNPKSLPQVNHKNGIKVDNRVENLEWCDGAYNQRHARATGLHANQAKGHRHGSAKLTEQDVREIRQITGLNNKQIADLYGVHRTTVAGIRRGEEWKWIK